MVRLCFSLCVALCASSSVSPSVLRPLCLHTIPKAELEGIRVEVGYVGREVLAEDPVRKALHDLSCEGCRGEIARRERGRMRALGEDEEVCEAGVLQRALLLLLPL